MQPIEFGWFLPTSGDTLDYGQPQQVPQSHDMFERVTRAAEDAGFEYMLLPVSATCWDAWMSSAFMVQRTRSIKMLVAARPSYVNPVLLARMIATFDQLSGGRISINLIAGQNHVENDAEGIRFDKHQRYEVMAEEVSILKAIWSSDAPCHFDGKYYQLKGAEIGPDIFQKPYPRFYLGGGSEQAWQLSAEHADVHLFWGDTVETIAANMAAIRELAARHGRADEIGFGMRLQLVCRETEAEAWEVAHGLIRNVTEDRRQFIKTQFTRSEANQRVQQLAREHGELIAPHLWTGLTQARPGAGIVIVGTPEQCAATLQQYIDIGCHSFCLSGYLHDEEAERFGRLVRPILEENNPGRISPLQSGRP